MCRDVVIVFETRMLFSVASECTLLPQSHFFGKYLGHSSMKASTFRQAVLITAISQYIRVSATKLIKYSPFGRSPTSDQGVWKHHATVWLPSK
jgi:hypothetical protein